MRKKRIVSLMLMGSMLMGSLILSLAGCAGQTGESLAQTQEIELLEPVNAQVGYEVAQVRSLYQAAQYGAIVIPYVEECVPQNNMYFGYYDALPGETVKKGQQIIVSDTERADEQIKDMQEAIDSMEEEYLKYVESQKKVLEKYREEESQWKRWVDLNEAEEPETYIRVPSEENPDETVEVENPAHAQWQSGYDMVTGKYRIAKHAADTVEMQLAYRKKLHDLDMAHQQFLLKEMQKERRLATVEACMDGTIVSVKDIQWYDTYLSKEKSVAAVADLTRKQLKCDYIDQVTIKKAKNLYALIDGKRYELEYQVITTEEYQELSAGGNKVYSVFDIVDAGDEVQAGDFATIALISDYREDAVSVSRGAIHKDSSGSFVYVLKDGQGVYTQIQTGISDGNYVEVLSGLEAGDRVVCQGGQTPGTETAVLGKGEFHTNFSEKGWMEYSYSYNLKNPVENGTVYYGEARVRLYQHVEKGDVIATVRVEKDSIALTRNETRLARLRERLADYMEENRENREEESYLESVKNYNEQIAELEKTLAKQKTDFATTEIRANREGVIVEMHEYKAEDIVQKNADIVRIADDSTCYVLVENKNQLLQFGNKVRVSYMNDQNQECTVEGMVASMSKMGVSSDLASDYSYILLPKDQIGDMMDVPNFGDGYWNRMRYTVEADTRVMENVVMVPRGAVYEMSGKTYVYVKDKDGNVKHRSFLAGGFNNDYYWVLDGLTEGMEVCLK